MRFSERLYHQSKANNTESRSNIMDISALPQYDDKSCISSQYSKITRHTEHSEVSTNTESYQDSTIIILSYHTDCIKACNGR